MAAIKEIAKNKTYNLEGIRPITVKKIAATVKKLIGYAEIEYKEERPDDFKGKSVSFAKATRELCWEPRVDFEEGVRRYIEWYKKNIKKYGD